MNKLNIGDTSDNGQITIIDEDRICYLVKSTSRGAVGIRTISKKLLEEYVAYFGKHPDATANDARDALSGNSDIDKFEYGYSSTLKIMAQMVLGQINTTTSTIGFSPKAKSTLPYPLQQIFYGAPGTGKSREVKKQTGELLDNGKEQDLPNVFRTTFHPDTDYASFVGCYKPTMKPTSKEEKTLTGKDEEIVYEFVPQTFTDAYIYAYTHSTEQTYLVIEEINRGNCAQIFGDLFQLLDRKGGISEYKIKADKDLANYLVDKLGEETDGIKDGKLCLPANLNILATMNTSDQSLFPIDSAFKRRWEWVYMPIDTEKEKWYVEINGGYYSWTKFLNTINDDILTDETAEDKHLGFYFCKPTKMKELSDVDPTVITAETFVGKVLFYLWNDVFKVYGIPTSIGASKDWAYNKFYHPDGRVNQGKVAELMTKLGIEMVGSINFEEENDKDDLIIQNDNQSGNLLVELNGKVIQEKKAIDTFAKVVELIGPAKIASLGLTVGRAKYALLSLNRLPADTDGGYGAIIRQIDGYWMLTKYSNDKKVNYLQKIAEGLNIDLKAKLV